MKKASYCPDFFNYIHRYRGTLNEARTHSDYTSCTYSSSPTLIGIQGTIHITAHAHMHCNCQNMHKSNGHSRWQLMMGFCGGLYFFVGACITTASPDDVCALNSVASECAAGASAATRCSCLEGYKQMDDRVCVGR